jgi:hypothetical protein
MPHHHHAPLGRDSMASSCGGSEGSLGRGGGHAHLSGRGTDFTLGGGCDPAARGPVALQRVSSVARQPVASGQWVSRKRDWRGGGDASKSGGGGGGTCDDYSTSLGGGGPPVPPHVILPNERGYMYWFLITLMAALWVS